MDIFKRNRFMTILIVLLVILNLGTMTMLWQGRSEKRAHGRPGRHPHQEADRLGELLRLELGFNETQIEQYLSLRHRHQKMVSQLDIETRDLKRNMFDNALKEQYDPGVVDSLLGIIQSNDLKIERLTFQHLVDLKNLCEPHQRPKLKVLIHQLFRPPQPPAGSARPAPKR